MAWAIAVFVFLHILSPAGADIISEDTFLLQSMTGEITVGRTSILQGPIAAQRDVELGDDIETHSVYSQGDVGFGDRATVRGKVLATKNILAGDNLDFYGSDMTGRNVGVGSDANIQGNLQARRNVQVGADARVYGDLLAGHNIWISKGSIVHGDASPGIPGRVRAGVDVTITGSTDPLQKTFADFKMAGMVRPDKPKFGRTNISRPAESVTSLAPGVYKDLSIQRDGELNLQSGTYTFKSFWMGRRGIVNVDTADGDVVINVHQGFDTGAYVQFNPTGQGRVIINVFGNGGMWLGMENVLKANVFVWDGYFTAGTSLDFIGTIMSHKTIDIGAGATLARSSGQDGYTIPEPAVMTTLIAGAGLLLRRRRKARLAA